MSQINNINNSGIFRKIQKHELNALLQLYTFLHDQDDPLPSREILEAVWTQVMENPWSHYFCIEYQQQMISSCVLTIIANLTRGARPYGLIENMVTDPSYRKRGFGTFLLQNVQEFAWQHGCYKVMLLTGRKDVATLQFYQKAGFDSTKKTAFISVNPIK